MPEGTASGKVGWGEICVQGKNNGIKQGKSMPGQRNVLSKINRMQEIHLWLEKGGAQKFGFEVENDRGKMGWDELTEGLECHNKKPRLYPGENGD